MERGARALCLLEATARHQGAQDPVLTTISDSSEGARGLVTLAHPRLELPASLSPGPPLALL